MTSYNPFSKYYFFLHKRCLSSLTVFFHSLSNSCEAACRHTSLLSKACPLSLCWLPKSHSASQPLSYLPHEPLTCLFSGGQTLHIFNTSGWLPSKPPPSHLQPQADPQADLLPVTFNISGWFPYKPSPSHLQPQVDPQAAFLATSNLFRRIIKSLFPLYRLLLPFLVPYPIPLAKGRQSDALAKWHPFHAQRYGKFAVFDSS